MPDRSSVFISWSGDKSRLIAEALRAWLPLVLNGPAPWVSSRDIGGGNRWLPKLLRGLEQSHSGILVLTPASMESPWLLFEAGALSRDVEESLVLPYLVGITADNLPDPLRQFQCASADEEGTFKVVIALSRAMGDEVSESVLKARFDAFWPQLKLTLSEGASAQQLNLQPAPIDRVSFEAVQRQLQDIASLLREIGTSVRPTGVFDTATSEAHLLASASDLRGAWFDPDSGTHAYTEIIHEKPVTAYCYAGNDRLSSAYYDWRILGDYWFGRFAWVDAVISGFAFYRFTASRELEGFWWYDADSPGREVRQIPDERTGVRTRWVRLKVQGFPTWASDFHRDVERGMWILGPQVLRRKGSVSITTSLLS